MDRLLALGDVAASSHLTTIDGRQFHWLEAGAGEPLLLLHGAGGGGANWYRLLGPLSQRYRVLAPDLPGFGLSDAIDARPPLGLQVATLLREWLSSLGIGSVNVAGTSFGGLAALRLPTLIETPRIIVIDSVGLSRAMSWRLRLATLPFIASLVVAPTRRGTRLLLHHVLTAGRLPRAHELALTDYLYESARGGDRRRMARAFTLFAARGAQRDVVSPSELAALAGRMQVIWGALDDFLPMAQVGDVRIIPDAGHSPNWENPAELLRVMTEFLNA